MSWYHFALWALACAALIASWHVPRCRLWIGALAASYLTCLAYIYLAPARYGGWPPHWPAIAFFCDASLYLLIQNVHKLRWEWCFLGTIAFAMATVNVLQLSAILTGWGAVLSPSAHASILEIANAAYLLVIGGIGLIERLRDAGWMGRSGRAYSRVASLAWTVSALEARAKRKTTAAQPLKRW